MSVSFPPRPFYPGEKAPGTHWMDGWMGPRAGLDTAVAKRKIPVGMRIPVIQSTASSYDDLAIPDCLSFGR